MKAVPLRSTPSGCPDRPTTRSVVLERKIGRFVGSAPFTKSVTFTASFRGAVWGFLCLAITMTQAMAQEVTQTSAIAVGSAVRPSFRVETEIFEGTEPKPQSQHLMLFDSGVVYALPVGVGTTITVFDPTRERVVLLHKLQKVKTSISTESLIRISAQIHAAALESEAGESLGLDAKVTVTETPDSYAIAFSDTTYTATTQKASNPSFAKQYSDFTVWACRLNLARQIGSPPFARITLAEYLSGEGLLPQQIKLEVRRGLKTRIFRAEHLFVGRLSDQDRQKISEVTAMIADYQEIDLGEFPPE